MFKILMAFATFLAISCANSSGHFENMNSGLLSVQVFNRTTISPGSGTDTVYLGQTKEEIIEVLGEPLNAMAGGRGNPRLCYETSLQWSETKELGSLGEGNGILAYLVNNKVVELYFSSKQYRTTGGVVYGLSMMNGGGRNKCSADPKA